METRLNLFSKGQTALKPLFLMGNYLKDSQIETALQELIKIRVSQINGCAYCLDMHWKEARANGETEQRLYGLSAWYESPYYSKRERAALKWAEAVICCKIPNTIYDEVSQHFTEEGLIDLTMVTSLINTWNQLNIAFPKVAGTYQVGQWS